MAHVGVEGEVHGGAGRQEWGAVSESSAMSLPAWGRARMLLWFLNTTQQGGKAVGRGQGSQREAWNIQTGQQAVAGEKSWLP